MTRKELLLTSLAEECTEVGQRVCKALRFGLEEKQKGQDFTNSERILHEFTDLMAVMEMCDAENIFEIDDEEIEINIQAKKDKVEKYLQYSQELGVLQ